MKYVTYTLLGFLLALLIGISLLLTTPQGLQWSYRLAHFIAPNAIRIDKLHGRLTGKIQLQGLYFATKSMIITVNKADLDSNLLNLLRNTIYIKKLTATGVKIIILPQKKQPKTTNDGDRDILPFYLTIHHTRINDFTVDFAGSNQRIHMQSLVVRTNIVPLAHSFLLNADLQWQNAYYQNKQENILSEHGELLTQGPTNKYTINLTTQVHGANLPTSEIALNGKGNETSININTTIAQKPHSKAIIKGNVTWYPDVTWQASINGKINPGSLLQDWPGHIIINASSAGKILNGKPEGNFILTKLAGNLRNFPLHGKGDVVLHDHRLSVDNFHLGIGKANLYVNGEVRHHWNLTWKLHIPDLIVLIPGASGQVVSHGQISGDLKLPNIEAVIDARNIDYDDFYLSKFMLKSKGSLTDHQIAIDMLALKQSLHLRLHGGLNNNILKLTLTQFDVVSPDFDRWHLTAPVNIHVNSDQVNISPLKLMAKHASISLQANYYSAHHWSGKFAIDKFHLDDIATLLGKDAQLHGIINANITGTAKPFHRAKLQGSVSLSSGYIQLPVGIRNVKQTFQGGSINFITKNKTLDTNINLALSKTHAIQGSIKLLKFASKGLTADQPVKGKLQFATDQLGIVSLFIADIREMQGQFTADVTINGTLAKPSVAGAIKLTNGSTKVPKLGLHVKDINIEAKTNAKKVLTYQGEATSGKGKVVIKGMTDLAAADTPTKLTITGNDVTVMNTTEYRLQASPKLKFNYANDAMELTGKIIIPAGIISPQDFTSAENPSSDIVYVHKTAKQQHRVPLTSDIELVFGDKILINTHGLTGRLAGEIKITETPARPTTARGKIKVVDGEYQVFGKTLKIKKGQLIFRNGFIDNPDLNIQAGREVNTLPRVRSGLIASALPKASLSDINQFSPGGTVTVGVEVHGTLKRPKIGLFSQPPGISDRDILSLLLTSKLTSQANKADAGMLVQAASALNPGGDTGEISHLQEELRQTFGLDELTVKSVPQINPTTGAAEEDTSVVLGKYLSPRLYVNYAFGIFSAISTLQVNYRIWRGLSIQTETTGPDTGIDLIYTFQSDD